MTPTRSVYAAPDLRATALADAIARARSAEAEVAALTAEVAHLRTRLAAAYRAYGGRPLPAPVTRWVCP